MTASDSYGGSRYWMEYRIQKGVSADSASRLIILRMTEDGKDIPVDSPLAFKVGRFLTRKGNLLGRVPREF